MDVYPALLGFDRTLLGSIGEWAQYTLLCTLLGTVMHDSSNKPTGVAGMTGPGTWAHLASLKHRPVFSIEPVPGPLHAFTPDFIRRSPQSSGDCATLALVLVLRRRRLLLTRNMMCCLVFTVPTIGGGRDRRFSTISVFKQRVCSCDTRYIIHHIAHRVLVANGKSSHAVSAPPITSSPLLPYSPALQQPVPRDGEERRCCIHLISHLWRRFRSH